MLYKEIVPVNPDFLCSILLSHNAKTVLLSILPIAYVLTFIWPLHFTVAAFVVILVFTCVVTS
jgi:hypothetical protein